MGLDQPGLLFVAATFLPLASFLFLILVGAVRFACRRYRETPGLAATIFHMLGGDVPARWPAVVATAAIAGAFVLSVLGAIPFFPDSDRLHHAEHELHHAKHEIEHKKKHTEEEQEKAAEPEKPAESKIADLKSKVKALETEIALLEHRWSGRIEWATLAAPTPPQEGEAAEPRHGTVLDLGFRIDSLNVVMFLMVTLVATLIHLFSMGYMVEELQPMHEDHQAHVTRRGRFGRFFLFLSLFCFSMLNLILADNLFQVFLSWELVGVCSYLLIGFYYERNSASTAAVKAFVTNRVGDAGFILGLLIIWSFLGTFNFEEIFARLRCPETHAHGQASLAGQIVLGSSLEETTTPAEQEAHIKAGIVSLKVLKPGEEAGLDTQVIILPREISGHFHGPGHVKEKHEMAEVDAYGSPDEVDYSLMPFWLLTVAGLGIFLGCVGKSAQFPLHVWLPDAMEGPTPVSALIHAATMVAAGVYLVGRVFPLFTADALLVIAYTGAITLLIGATIAVAQTDIKKVLAYSTVSQLGYMMLGLGVGGWVAGLFHLVTHAFFKALMFLGSGSVIYGCHHEQHMGKMGGLFRKMPITAITMLIGVLAICGIPAFSGWYSKDAILASAAGFVFFPKNSVHFLLFLMPLVTAGLTTFYMFRMWFMTFTGKPRDQHVHDHAKESPWLMTLPLIILAIFSVIVAWGWPFFDSKFPFVNAESSLLEQTIHHAAPEAALKADFGQPMPGDPHPNITVHNLTHEYHYLAGLLALVAVAIGFGFSYALYYARVLDPDEARQQAPGVYRFLWHKWYFDELYSVAVVRPTLVVGTALKWVDLNVIDGIIHGFAWLVVRVSKWDGLFDSHVVDGLVNLVARVVYGVGGWFRTFQTGYLRNYVLFLVMAAVAIFVAVSYFVARVLAG